MVSPPSTPSRSTKRKFWALSHAYRIVSPKYPPFDGAGTHRWGSRWISPGRWIVHAAETYALAVLENLVHWQTSALPSGLVCIEVEVPSDIKREEIDPADLPASASGDFSAFRAIGDDWYDRSDTAVLWVPSLVSPFELNVLFNQRHGDFRRIVIYDSIPARIDPRLWLQEK